MIAYLVWCLVGFFCGVVWTLAIGAVLGNSHIGTISVLLIGVIVGLVAACVIRGIMVRLD